MDIVKQKRLRESVLVGLVGAMALMANLPPHLLDRLGIDVGLLLAIMGLVVVMALFLYVRFFFFLIYTLLALGANLPEKWATEFGISQTALLATLITMVLLSLLNYSVKLVPTGLTPKKSPPNPDATNILIKAIDKGNYSYIKTILTMNFDLDLPDGDGMTPLMRAANRGDMKLVNTLIEHGASALINGPEGRASDIALKANFPSLTTLLKAREELESKSAPAQEGSQEPELVIS